MRDAEEIRREVADNLASLAEIRRIHEALRPAMSLDAVEEELAHIHHLPTAAASSKGENNPKGDE